MTVAVVVSGGVSRVSALHRTRTLLNTREHHERSAHARCARSRCWCPLAFSPNVALPHLLTQARARAPIVYTVPRNIAPRIFFVRAGRHKTRRYRHRQTLPFSLNASFGTRTPRRLDAPVAAPFAAARRRIPLNASLLVLDVEPLGRFRANTRATHDCRTFRTRTTLLAQRSRARGTSNQTNVSRRCCALMPATPPVRWNIFAAPSFGPRRTRFNAPASHAVCLFCFTFRISFLDIERLRGHLAHATPLRRACPRGHSCLPALVAHAFVDARR